MAAWSNRAEHRGVNSGASGAGRPGSSAAPSGVPNARAKLRPERAQRAEVVSFSASLGACHRRLPRTSSSCVRRILLIGVRPYYESLGCGRRFELKEVEEASS